MNQKLGVGKTNKTTRVDFALSILKAIDRIAEKYEGKAYWYYDDGMVFKIKPILQKRETVWNKIKAFFAGYSSEELREIRCLSAEEIEKYRREKADARK